MDREQRVKELEEKLTNTQKALLHVTKQGGGIVRKNLDYKITMLKEEVKKAKDGPEESWDMSI